VAFANSTGQETGKSAELDLATAPATLHPIHAWWTVGVLALLQTLSLLDRHILSLMIIEVRTDMGLDDFQVSLLHGLAFTGFYFISLIFMGRLVDSYPARRILYFTVTLWSLAASSCGLVKSYWGMMAARMVTGVGEGSVSPSAQSVIASLFPKSRVSFPMSLFLLSGALGIGLSYFGGGLLLEALTAKSAPGLEGLAPWRQVLIVTAAPGIVIAFLSFTLLEKRPLTGGSISTAESWREMGRFLSVERQLFTRLLLGYGMNGIVTYAVFSWAPTYGRRVLGLSPAEIGTQMGLISTIGGLTAAAIYGAIVDRQFARGRIDFVLRAFTIGALFALPVTIAGFVMDNHTVFIAGIIAVQFLLSAALGPAVAAFLIATPPVMRGRMAALVNGLINLAGYAFGPMVIGALTEYVFRDPQKIGWSVALTAVVLGPLSAWTIWSARPYFIARIKGSAGQ
jgi:MFS family permease